MSAPRTKKKRRFVDKNIIHFPVIPIKKAIPQKRLLQTDESVKSFRAASVLVPTIKGKLVKKDALTLENLPTLKMKG